jgi:delta endotoxin, N-terminal domain
VALSRAISQDSVLETTKLVVTTALSKIPFVGDVISVLVSTLWPTPSPNVWETVKGEVEKMIDQKINEFAFNAIEAKLIGAGKALKEYLAAIKTQNNQNITQHWVACKLDFVGDLPLFQIKGHEWELAPLFALFVQHHMALLRDGVFFGKSWGWDDATHQTAVASFASCEVEYDQYLRGVVDAQRLKLQKLAPTVPGRHKTDIHNYWQQFEQTTILLIDDYRLLLKHYKLRPPFIIPFQDVYSRAYGTADDWDGYATQAAGAQNGVRGQYSQPLVGFQTIDLEIFNQAPRVVDVSYARGKGPLTKNGSRTDKYGIIAVPKGGVQKNTVNFPASTPTKSFSVKGASLRVGSIPLSLTLKMDDGSDKWMWDRTSNPGGERIEVSVPGRMLTTLNMWTRSKFYDDTLGCIIFGFSRDPNYVPPKVRRARYIGTIGEPDPEDMDGDSTLPAKRRTYWRDIESHSVWLFITIKLTTH